MKTTYHVSLTGRGGPYAPAGDEKFGSCYKDRNRMEQDCKEIPAVIVFIAAPRNAQEVYHGTVVTGTVQICTALYTSRNIVFSCFLSQASLSVPASTACNSKALTQSAYSLTSPASRKLYPSRSGFTPRFFLQNQHEWDLRYWKKMGKGKKKECLFYFCQSLGCFLLLGLMVFGIVRQGGNISAICIDSCGSSICVRSQARKEQKK